MKAFRNSVAVLALLTAGGLAYAQDTTVQPAPEPDKTQAQTQTDPNAVAPAPADQTAPADQAQTKPDPSAAQPEPADEADQNVTKTNPAEPPKAEAAAPAVQVDPNAIGAIDPASAFLASNFIGQTVYSSANENVGEINDLVMSKNKDAVVAVIGVGGFLGMGEKDVAVGLDKINISKDENNNMHLTIAASREQLEAAPAFDRTTFHLAQN